MDLDEVEAGEGERRVKVATWNMLAQTLVRKSTNLCAPLVLSFIDRHVSHDLFHLISIDSHSIDPGNSIPT